VRYFKEKIKLNVVKWPFMPILSLLTILPYEIRKFSVVRSYSVLCVGRLTHAWRKPE